MVDYTKKASSISPMTTGELGSSLLAQKSAREERDRKSAKRNDKIAAALGLAVGASGLARKAYQKREAELNAAKTIAAKNNKIQSQQINTIANLVSVIPENFMPNEKDVNKKVKAYMDTPDYNVFKTKMNPFIDKKIKSALPADEYNSWMNSSAYNKTLRLANEELLTQWFTVDDKTGKAKYENFVNDFRTAAGEQDLDRQEAIKRAMAITEHDLTQLEAQHYRNIAKQYKDNNNFLGGVVEIGKRFGTKEGRNGGINLFNKITEEQIGTAPLDSTLNSLNLGGNLNGMLDKAIAVARVGDEGAKAEYESSNMKKFKEEAVPLYITNMLELVKEGEYKSKVTGGLTFVGSNDLKEYLEIVSKSPNDEATFLKDVGILSIRLKDRQYQKAIYKAYYQEGDELSLAQFQQNMQNIETRTQYAAGMVLEQGLDITGGVFGTNFGKDRKYSTKDIQYTRGIVPLMTGELNIIKPDLTKSLANPDNTYSLPTGYNTLSRSAKILSFDAEYQSIVTSKESETIKEALIIKLFEEIGNPDDLDYEEYKIDLGKRIKENKQRIKARREKSISNMTRKEFSKKYFGE